MRWKLKAAAAVCLLLLVCTACGSEQEAESGSVYDIYYVNNEETAFIVPMAMPLLSASISPCTVKETRLISGICVTVRTSPTA